MTLRPFADMYCWCCHLEDAMYSCKKCPRTYHRRCVFEMPNYPEPTFNPDSMDPSSMDMCPECVVAENTVLNNMKKVGPTQLRSILRHVIYNLKHDENWHKTFYEIRKPKSNTRSRAVVVKFMDIAMLERHVEKEAYKSLEGFFGDAKWIRHNIAVTTGRRSDEMNIADKLLHFIASEMLEIDLCHECYVRKQNVGKMDNWFVFACSRPHLLGWAKLNNFAYWPAKIMGIDMEKKLALVHFFGGHTQEELPLNQCFVYCEEPPGKTKKISKQLSGWKTACKEMKKHLEYLEERHGKVVLAEGRIRITCTLTEAVQRMFPDWKLKMMNESAAMRDSVTSGFLDLENDDYDDEFGDQDFEDELT